VAIQNKLTFQFDNQASFKLDGNTIDLRKMATDQVVLGKDGKEKTIQGFKAADGLIYSTKKTEDGKYKISVYGEPEALAKQKFSVRGGDISGAQFGDLRLVNDKPAAGTFSIDPGSDTERINSFAKTFGLRERASFSAEAKAVNTMPIAVFKNHGNTCYLNATLKSMLSGMGGSFVSELEAERTRRLLQMTIEGRQPLNEIRETLIALAKSTVHPGRQQDVDTHLQKLVSQLNDPILKTLAAEAEKKRVDLGGRFDKTNTPLDRAHFDQNLAKVALRLVNEKKSAEVVLKSLSEESEAARSFKTSEALQQFISEKDGQIKTREDSHIENLKELNSEAAKAGFSDFFPYRQALTTASNAGAYINKVNQQQDATEFGRWLRDTMNLAPSGERFEELSKIVNVWNEPTLDERGESWSLVLNPQNSSDSLQTLTTQKFAPETVELAAAGGSATKSLVLKADLQSLQRINMSLDGTNVRLTDIDFNAKVEIQMTDDKTGAEKAVVLRPIEITFHEGADNAGHYYAYVRRGAEWYRHDDDKPVVKHALPDLGVAQPRAIAFEVVEVR
jgi:hypothetical protein